MIEVGRYKQPKIPRNERYCPFCDSLQIEDEIHFLFHCNVYECQRENVYIELGKNINEKLKKLPDDSKLKFLLEIDDQKINFVLASYIYQLFKRRKELLSPE